MDLGIQDRIVLIAGASRGLGAATARYFAAEGCRVGMVARSGDKLLELHDSIGGDAAGHSFVALDLLEKGAPEHAVKELESRMGDFDIVINVVGGGLAARDPLSSAGDWMLSWQFNVGIAIQINNRVIPGMKSKKWGRIVHVSSISGRHLLGDSLYSASKAFLNSYSKTLARKVAQDGIVVSSVLPGVFEFEDSYWEQLKKKDPLRVKTLLTEHMFCKRIGTVGEIAPFILLLASEHASFAHGAEFNIDGGTV